MPTNTFFNLSNEKKDNIINAAKKEFCEKAFYDASINKIIKEAGISRGAFYLYFENKEDLFTYIMQEYRKCFLSEISKSINSKENDIFDMALIVFDYITSEDINKEFQKFFCNNISKIDLDLINNCLDFNNEEQDIKVIKEYTNINNLNIKDDKELIYISELVLSCLMKENLDIFLERSTVKESRRKIERKFELIKNGIIK